MIPCLRRGAGRLLVERHCSHMPPGKLADLFDVFWAISLIAGVTFLAGVIAQGVMAETLPRK